ncbi:hypothetical protein QFX18_06905 [Saccharophagus degradans]|uniref:hypothetical protein n=1 Tax=Cellvibrionaceae TaxID=1706371 RepID=UPI000BB57669|nr:MULTISPECIES: hypothetical protein [Cellvibrionaceae]WGO99791.1 hypothetical protein QFX18_06905 [Saccharophagus degradans]
MAHSPLDGRTTDEYTSKILELFKASEIDSISIDAGGTGYSPGDSINVIGDGTGASAEVATVDGGGGITGITITNSGSGYSYAEVTAPVNDVENDTPAELSATVTLDLLNDMVAFDEDDQQVDRLKQVFKTSMTTLALNENQATLVLAALIGLPS